MHLCCLQLHNLLSLTGTSGVECPQRYPGQSTPGKRGELCRARSSSADVCGCKPMEPLCTKGIIVSWKNLVNLQFVKYKKVPMMIWHTQAHSLWLHAVFVCIYFIRLLHKAEKQLQLLTWFLEILFCWITTKCILTEDNEASSAPKTHNRHFCYKSMIKRPN